MLILKHVSKAFDDHQVLSKINLSVKRGHKTTIIGPSGSGKSTILKLILGLIPPDSGKLTLNGTDINALSIKDIYIMRKKIGLLFQSAALFDSLTVEENVGFSLTETPSTLTNQDITNKVNLSLELVGMQDYNNHYPAELSGGQKKRVALARAIINKPEYLLFDEPTTGLDPILSTNIEDLIVQISEELNTATITVTHQISTILRSSDSIYFLHEGQLLDPETPESIVKTKDPIISPFIRGKSNG